MREYWPPVSSLTSASLVDGGGPGARPLVHGGAGGVRGGGEPVQARQGPLLTVGGHTDLQDTLGYFLSQHLYKNKAKCLLEPVETPLSLLDCHTLCLIGLHHVVKLELSRIF